MILLQQMKAISRFKNDSEKFAELTGKPMVLDSMMTACLKRPVVDILATDKQFGEYEGSMNDRIGLEATNIIEKYI